MKKLVLFSVAFFAVGPAFATDLINPVPPPTFPPPLWTGPFLGGSLGFGFGQAGNDVSSKDLFCAGDVIFCSTPLSEQNFLVPGGTSNSTSFAGGGQLGYDFQLDPNLVVGGVIDVTALDRSAGRTFRTSPLPVGTNVTESRTYTDSFAHDWLATARLRVGPTFDNLWLYGTGGLALGELESTSSSVTTWNDPYWTPPGPEVAASGRGSSSGAALGYAVGAGAEYRFTPDWSVFAEYLYYSLRRSYTVVVTPNSALTGITNPASYSVKAEVDGNLVKLGVNYAFSTY